jgi:hypothetical protein
MTEVGFASLGDGVMVDIDDAVDIECDGLGDSVKLLEVVLAIGDVCWRCKGGKVAYGGLIREEYLIILVQRLEDLMGDSVG